MYIALELFLPMNGFDFIASDVECVVNMLSVASGDNDVPPEAKRLRRNMARM